MDSVAERTTRTPGDWFVVDGINIQSGPIGALKYVSTGQARGRTHAEAKANAVLMAAAPKLLAACEAAFLALGRAGANTLDGPNRLEWEQCRAAIAEAERAV
jgi:hypothetical protein